MLLTDILILTTTLSYSSCIYPPASDIFNYPANNSNLRLLERAPLPSKQGKSPLNFLTSFTNRACRIIRDEAGMIQSPNYPQHYNNHMDYCWKIQPPQKSQIYVTFLAFNIEAESSCANDWLTIQPAKDRRFQRLCGSEIPINAVYDTTSINIRFHTDESVTKSGFSLLYSINIPPKAKADTTCAVYTSPRSIRSNGVNGYENNERKCWIIVADNRSLILKFQNFELEEEDECIYDNLVLVEGVNIQGKFIGKYCHQKPDDIVIAAGKSLYMLFTTDETQTDQGFKATVEEHKYKDKSLTECGISYRKPNIDYNPQSERLLDGIRAIPFSWPWHASVRTNNGKNHACGAAVLSKSWLITTAACVSGPLRFLKVVAGDFSLKTIRPQEQHSTVVRVVTHPKWKKSKFINDIALLRVDPPLEFNERVKPICLPESDDIPTPEKCWTTGWNWAEGQSEDRSNLLFQVTTPIISNDDCKQYDGYKNKLTENMTCVDRKNTRRKCRGDRGGPLICMNSSPKSKDPSFFIYGVNSWGSFPCTVPASPTVFTKVSKYLPWIRQVIGEQI